MCLDNNLFRYATSELSQDAFICWLASHDLVDEGGAYVSNDAALQSCAKRMLAMFVPEFNGKDYSLICIEKQKFSVDVLLTVKCDGNLYKIIVEDKTYTNQHDNQLLRYKEVVQKAFPDSNVRGVYYKTWFQSDLKKVVDANYRIVMREDMLALMEDYIDKTENQIFLDYFAYWNHIHLETEKYKDKPTNEWDYRQVFGFYEHFKNDIISKLDMYEGYGYVANPSGGFDGCWFGMCDNAIVVDGYELGLYMQINATYEDACSLFVCLKINSSDVPSELRSKIRNKIIYGYNRNLYEESKYGIKKPDRLGSGVYMTIGVYEGCIEGFTTYAEFEKFLCESIEKYKILLMELRNS